MTSRVNSASLRSRVVIAGSAALVIMTSALTGCGDKDSKKYDISPIFPLSSDKCAKYDGKAEGSGLDAHCYVTKTKCEQAAADWRQAMNNNPNAILFRC